MTKLYRVWKGNNRFACWGRCIFGPDVRSLLLSLVLITTPTALFCGFVAANLKDKLPGGVAILPVAIVFVTWVVFILLYTASRDPGIVPRNPHPPEPDLEADGGEASSGLGRGRLPRTKDVIINGTTVKIKYCDTCMLYRPPRCSHCSICNNCVERFDHHCPWVGQCIGKRNYRYFFAFVSSTTLLCIFVFAICAVQIKVLMDNNYSNDQNAHPRNLWKAMAKSPVAVVLMAYTFIAVWFVGGLTSFHTYLMLSNQTTYENFRYRYDKKTNPYNRGALHNIYETLCSPISPSRNNFRAEVLTSVPQGPTLAGVVPRIPSKPISRTSSRASSGTRSPSTKEYQPLDMQRLGDDPPLKDRERNNRGRRGSTDGNGERRDGGKGHRGLSSEDSQTHYGNASGMDYFNRRGQHGERNSVEITTENNNIGFRM